MSLEVYFSLGVYHCDSTDRSVWPPDTSWKIKKFTYYELPSPYSAGSFLDATGQPQDTLATACISKDEYIGY